MKGYFQDVNDNEYVIDIADGSNDEVVLGGQPITTSYDNKDDIYTPARYSGSTINIVSSSFRWGLYSSNPMGVKVTLSDSVGGGVKWVGYVSPTLYTQSYVNDLETIAVDCIDGLSVLQYIKYQPIETTDKIRSFREIITYCVSKCQCYKAIYVSNINSISNDYWWRQKGSGGERPSLYDDYNIIELLCVSEAALKDDEGEYWTYQKVLEEICKYLSLTMIAQGDMVYFVDYDAISVSGRVADTDASKYTRYFAIEGTWDITERDTNIINNRELKTINGAAHRGQSTLALDKVYNSVSIKTLPKELIVFHEIDDDDVYTLKTIDKTTGAIIQHDKVTEVHALLSPTEYGDEYWAVYQYVVHPKWHSYIYRKSVVESTPIDGIDIRNSKMLEDYSGGTIIKYQKAAHSGDDTEYALYKDLGCLNPNLYVLLHQHEIYYEDAPRVLLTSYGELPAPGTTTGYIAISGNVLFQRWATMSIPQTATPPEVSVDGDDCYLWARLVWGNRYWWNGRGWQLTACDFKLYLTCDDSKLYGNSMPIRNDGWQFRWRGNLNNAATYIHFPYWEKGHSNISNGTVPDNADLDCTDVSKLAFSIYNTSKLKDQIINSVWISDLDVKVCTWYTGKNGDDDTVYTEKIDANIVDEMPEEEVAICTYDSKTQSPSFVAIPYAWANGNTALTEREYFYMLNHVTNSAHNCGAAGANAKLEAIRASKKRLQYSQPAKMLTCVLDNNIKPYTAFRHSNLVANGFLVWNTMFIDWANNLAEVQLVEKPTASNL